MFFLSGLPRSGSTLLSAILNQNPAVYVSATSNLEILMGSLTAAWENSPKNVETNKAELHALLKSVMDAKYAKIDKPIIIDKSRSWPDPMIMETMTAILGKPPKIVATVRNVPDCAASFVRVVKPANVPEFLRSAGVIQHLKSSYVTLEAGLKAAPDNIMIVDYDELVTNPHIVVANIHQFLGLPEHTYDLQHIDGEVVKENDDEAWGIPGLHDIRPQIAKAHVPSARSILGGLYDEFDQKPFWKAEEEPREPKLLDRQLEHSLNGRFDEAWELAKQIEVLEPDNDRAAFNRGWFLLRQGKLREGHDLLDRGRLASVFGNPHPGTQAPLWTGEAGKTVILSLEGGVGDQIHGLRWVREITKAGSRCIVSCSAELVGIVRTMPGVDAVIGPMAITHAWHDAWLPAMSAPGILRLNYEDVDSSPFIEKPPVAHTSKFRIGIRWNGSPTFEHEQHRRFDPELLFKAVKGYNADFISLQRDDGEESRPAWAKEVDLTTWKQTQVALASCNLVITSCTSVAHLSAAMGIPTWIVVPVLPYYLWAVPGDSAVWYRSVRLFRQTTPQSWTEPFLEVADALWKGI